MTTLAVEGIVRGSPPSFLSLAETYMHSILGQQHPFELAKEDVTKVKTAEAKALLNAIDINALQDHERHTAFYRGLNALVVDGNLTQAYYCFVEASKHADAESLEIVFYAERAVNIAFWMACSGKKLDAAKDLTSILYDLPYAAGVLSFAMYMNHGTTTSSIEEAEDIALQAMAKGFQDPWTLHAVAHCLYAQGKSKECSVFLSENRRMIQQSKPSAFMKGHMEFHQALCYIDMEDAETLHGLIDGPLWKGLDESEKQDYWNAAGLLNVQWKAEIRGLVIHPASIKEAMEVLMPIAATSKSPVFSLCILRWSIGAFRKQWKEGLLMSSNAVLRDLANAVDLVYPSLSNGELPAFSAEGTSAVLNDYLASNIDNLDKLGASPEQREVVEEFLVIAAKTAGAGKLPISRVDMSGWTKRNYRPKIHFYQSVLELKKTENES